MKVKKLEFFSKYKRMLYNVLVRCLYKTTIGIDSFGNKELKEYLFSLKERRK